MITSDELRNYVKRYKEGDSEAFEGIYRMSYAYLHICIMHVVKDEDVAQDMLQETYMEISRSIGQLKELENFLSWAAVIANRKCFAFLKKRNSGLLIHEEDIKDKDLLEKISDNEEFIPESLVENKEKQRLIKEIIDGLSDMQRLCVIGFYYNELSQEEIANELGIPLNTVKSHLNRAKAKIKDAVVELDEKKGTRLYALAPFMLLFLGAEAKACEVPPMSDALIREAGISGTKEGPAKESIESAGNGSAEAIKDKPVNKSLMGKYAVAFIVGLTAVVGIIWMIASNRTGGNKVPDNYEESAEMQPENDIQEEPQQEVQEQESETQAEASEEAGLNEILVLDASYESYGNAYGGSIPVKKNGMWGAINYDNNEIVPCEYTNFYAAPDNSGNFILYNSDIMEYFLFDNAGKTVYQGTDKVRASGGMYITLHEGDETARIEYHSMDGTVLVSEECEVAQARINGFYDGISNIYNSVGSDYIYVDMGSAAPGPYEDDIVPRIGTVDLSGDLSWREDPYYYIWWDIINASLSKSSSSGSANAWGNGEGASSFLGRTPLSTMNNGYYVTGNDYIEAGLLMVYDEQDNRVAKMDYFNLSVSADGTVSIGQTTYNEMNTYHSFYTDGVPFYNYGSKMVFEVDGKYVLMDFAKNTGGDDISDAAEVVTAVYDYISMADEKYWLVQSGEEWGYIDHDGNEMAMFDDAGAFVNGYALVIDEGEAWFIDEEFNKLESLGQADSVGAMGELYRMNIGDDIHVFELIQ
ncbi:MAG: sigma-70 family RNA polymerase sigma factor [Lachnospiraceae bacterium]|nr:sigma-70 family RNA polymerase sigma factor [Lachnospiraceae bacterium]